jgi:hypothetical protein
MTNKNHDSKLNQSQEILSHRQKYLKQLQEDLKDTLHKRIIAAYLKKDDPIASMEAELGEILTEVLSHED